MFLSYLTQFPTESITVNIIPLFCVSLCMAEFFSILFLKRVGGIQGFFSKSKSVDDSEDQVMEKNKYFEMIGSEDLEVVMERLGIFCHSEDEKLQERLDSNDIAKLFEEKEPSLDELKGAFDLFDENRDGSIDSRELQRVLCVLEFKEGLEMENCMRMIGLFDENGDGRIDFSEFVKMMENSFT